MADHMTAEQLRAELSALNEFLGVVSGYAKIDDERVRLARGRMTSLAARLSGMAQTSNTWNAGTQSGRGIGGRTHATNRSGSGNTTPPPSST